MKTANYNNYFDNLIKQSKSEKKQVAVYLDVLTLDRVEAITYQLGLTRNRLIEDAINMYLEEAEKHLIEYDDTTNTPTVKVTLNENKHSDLGVVNAQKSTTTTGGNTTATAKAIDKSSLVEKIESLKSVRDLVNLYDNQDMPMELRREAHKEDKRNNVTFYALTESRVIHDDAVPSDLSGLSGASQAYYIPEHGRYIARGGKDTLRKHAKVLDTLNGKSFNPKEVPIASARLAVTND